MAQQEDKEKWQIRLDSYFKPTWRGNFVGASDQPTRPREPLPPADATSSLKVSDVKIGAKTVSELRAALEQIIRENDQPEPQNEQEEEEIPLEEEAVVQQPPEEKKKKHKKHKEKDKKKSKKSKKKKRTRLRRKLREAIFDWLRMLQNTLHYLLNIANLSSHNLKLISGQVNLKLDEISQIEQQCRAGEVKLRDKTQLFYLLMSLLDWLEEQSGLWEILTEEEDEKNKSTFNPETASVSNLHVLESVATPEEQVKAIQRHVDSIKMTVRNNTKSHDASNSTLSKIFASVLALNRDPNSVEIFWATQEMRSGYYEDEEDVNLRFLVEEHISFLIAAFLSPQLSFLAENILQEEQKWFDHHVSLDATIRFLHTNNWARQQWDEEDY